METGGAKVFLSLSVINIVLAGASTLSLRWYYAQYHFGVGARYASLMIGFPAAILLGFVVGLGALAIARRSGTRANAALAIATLAIALTLAIVLGLEWWRTTDQRVGELEALAAAAPNPPLQQPNAPTIVSGF
jgi:hypothetical protein